MDRDDVEFDEYCDASNPRKIKFEDIAAAARRISKIIPCTPCSRSFMSDKLGMEIYLKQEFLQFTGCFKERGLCNTLLLLSDEKRKNGVIAASTGNHGCAVSYHSTQMGIPSVVVMPVNAPTTKVKKCQKFGAKLILHGKDMAEAKHFAMAMSKEKNMLYINGFDHPNVIEGQGTIGLEILEQVPNVDAVVVPCGGGSLLAGVAIAIKHLKPDTEVYGVETDKTCSMIESLKKNCRHLFPIGPTLADGLGVNMVGVNTFHSLKGHVDKMLVVKEQWVARAILHTVENERFIVEGAGVTPLAAIMSEQLSNLKGKTVVLICTGGNIDTATLARALERGMAAEGRLVKFKVTVMDRPGAMAELCHLIANTGCTLREFVPEKCWVKGRVFSVELKICVETKGWEHTKELVEAIKKHYKDSVFQDMVDKSEEKTTRRGPCLAPQPACMMK